MKNPNGYKILSQSKSWERHEGKEYNNNKKNSSNKQRGCNTKLDKFIEYILYDYIQIIMHDIAIFHSHV